VKEQVDAKKKVLGPADALALLAGADDLYVAKGKKVVHVDLKKDKPDLDSLVPMMLGPTGNLRAPALRKGKIVMVGFDDETYRKLFG